MLKKIISLGLALFTIFGVYTRDVKACVCGAGNSVLEEFEWAEHVFTAKVISIKKADAGSNRRYAYDVKSATMIVGKVYKGSLKPGETIEFDQQEAHSDCIYTFSEEDAGQEFLLYINGSPAKFTPFVICGRSSILGSAIDDVSYLDNLDKVKGKTRISGQLRSQTNGSPDFAGRKVRIHQGNKLWEVSTDTNNFYEIYDLPAGEYDIEPELPIGWRISPYSTSQSSSVTPGKYADIIDSKTRIKGISVVLKEGRHASLDILTVPDTAIRGRVLSPSERPMEGVCMHAQFLDDAERWSEFDCTDKNGAFDIDKISEGKYILTANKNGVISDDMPFRTLYYPGVPDMEKAKVFSITPGTFFNDIEFRIPEFSKTIRISATTVYSDGKTVDNTGTSLEFIPDNKKEKSPISPYKYSRNGIFSFMSPYGLTGNLEAIIVFKKGEFLDCPEVERLFREKDKQEPDEPAFADYLQIRSKEVWISGEGDADVSLYFQFPYCKRRDE